MTPTVSASPRPAVENAAFYVALLFGALSILASPLNPMGLIQGPLYLLSAWGIRRERAWSAYGLTLLSAVSTGVLVITGMAGPLGPSSLDSPAVRIGLLFAAAIATLLFLGGRSIERRLGRTGLAWPWIAASVFAGGFLALFGLYQVPTGSMENTLLIGDHLAVRRSHGAPPSRGEMVVHIYPVNRRDVFIKRVVGLPGDHVRIRNKQLFVNGVEAAEPYVIHKTEYVDSFRDNFPNDPNVSLYPAGREMLEKSVRNGEVVVPPGRYFVLGDNRDSSLDSRYWGFIQQADIIGTPKFVYLSIESGGMALMHLRWNRMLHPVR